SVIGTPTRGPNRRMLVGDHTANLQELEITNNAVTSVDTGTTPVAVYWSPNLTDDGLRLVMWGDDGLGGQIEYYLDRPDFQTPFALHSLGTPGMPYSNAVLTSDCGRLYFLSSGSLVMYVEQL